MRLKLLKKEQFKIQQQQLVILLVKKLLIELRKSQKLHNKKIQKQLKMSIIKKYLKKKIFPEER